MKPSQHASRRLMCEPAPKGQSLGDQKPRDSPVRTAASTPTRGARRSKLRCKHWRLSPMQPASRQSSNVTRHRMVCGMLSRYSRRIALWFVVRETERVAPGPLCVIMKLKQQAARLGPEGPWRMPGRRRFVSALSPAQSTGISPGSVTCNAQAIRPRRIVTCCARTPMSFGLSFAAMASASSPWMVSSSAS
jgi:hypothetical protein